MLWPEVHLEFPWSDIRVQTQRAYSALEERTEIRSDLARLLRELIAQDFETKSNGRTGAGGIRWRAIAATSSTTSSSTRIGNKTGSLSASLRVIASSGTGPDVIARYTAPHAAQFDRRRLLIPETCPPEWQERLEKPVAAWSEQQIQKEVKS